MADKQKSYDYTGQLPEIAIAPGEATRRLAFELYTGKLTADTLLNMTGTELEVNEFSSAGQESGIL